MSGRAGFTKPSHANARRAKSEISSFVAPVQREQHPRALGVKARSGAPKHVSISTCRSLRRCFVPSGFSRGRTNRKAINIATGTDCERPDGLGKPARGKRENGRSFRRYSRDVSYVLPVTVVAAISIAPWNLMVPRRNARSYMWGTVLCVVPCCSAATG